MTDCKSAKEPEGKPATLSNSGSIIDTFFTVLGRFFRASLAVTFSFTLPEGYLQDFALEA